MSDKLKIKFLGGIGSTSGVSLLLEFSGRKILFDAGLYAGCDSRDQRNAEVLPFNPSEIDFIFISHSDLQHAGRIPKLVRDGFKGIIYSTSDTKPITELILSDCMSSAGDTGIYNASDLDKSMSLWRTVQYKEAIDVGGDLKITLFDSNHVLGAALFKVQHGDKTLIVANALGNPAAEEFRNSDDSKNVNYLIVESVYGDKVHSLTNEREEFLEDVVEETINRRGTVLMPISSINKIYVVLQEIRKLRENGRIPMCPVFVDSTLAAKAISLYGKLFKCDCGTLDQFIERFAELKFVSNDFESEEMLKNTGPKIVLGGISVLSMKRFDGYVKKFVTDPNSSMIFIDFQPAGSIGRLLEEGSRSIDIGGERFEVMSQIETIDGYSSHADHNELFKFVDDLRGDLFDKVFVTVGEPKAEMYFTQKLRDYMGVNASIPKLGDEVELEF